MTSAELANAFVSGVVVVCTATFMITYHLRAPWRSTVIGWYLMTFAASIGMLCLYTVLITAWGLDGLPATILRFIRTALLLAVGVVMIQCTRMVITAQRVRDAAPDEPPAQHDSGA
ncbi:putative phage holin [Streptomyces sp. H27-D2]|uniref:putative phage holin n=1 Tax=Streptomyces sp. H27-D2 TaxID=3046304 RepID=UPI002DBCFEA7|nr:hypothetical protein [Streptomyces sp. H27-D2]MEC4016122.1 hypothetical protein [Streptomyces sp. H27-D2]